MGYFTAVGPRSGPILWRERHATIGVLDSGDRPWPVGTAFEVGWGGDGVSLWKLIVRDVELPGLWFVVDRQFHPAQDKGRGPSR